MVDLINEWFSQFNVYTKANPVIAGVVSLWGLAVITFLFRQVPAKIYNLLKGQLTTTLLLNSQDTVFYQVLNWVSENHLHRFVRSLNAHNGRRGYGAEDNYNNLSMGFGITFFVFNKRLFIFRRKEIDANQTEFTKEQIIITLVGRNHSIFQDFISEITKKKDKDLDYIDIFTFRDGAWTFVCKQFKRSIDTIIIEKKVKSTLFSFIDEFNSSKDWYISRGIPYRTGILLTGPAGTGKTSLIKGLCSFYSKDLYIISNLNHLTGTSLDDALSSVPQGSIVAIEDIDSQGINLSRMEMSDEDLSNKKLKKQESNKNTLTISNILNAIDGVTSAEDRILLATTNHPEILDEALLREGRFDLKLKLDYINDEMLKEYLALFYPEFSFPVDVTVRPKIAMCKVQKLVFDHRDDPKALIEAVTEPKIPEPIVMEDICVYQN